MDQGEWIQIISKINHFLDGNYCINYFEYQKVSSAFKYPKKDQAQYSFIKSDQSNLLFESSNQTTNQHKRKLIISQNISPVNPRLQICVKKYNVSNDKGSETVLFKFKLSFLLK
ncbi:hypothetical protein ABPG72_015481 [Tetrahymena utriculariae]